MAPVTTDYVTPPIQAPDPFDVDRANRSAEYSWWRPACDDGRDTAFARARRAAGDWDWTKAARR